MWWANVNLRTKLFVSYLLVVLVGMVAIFIAMSEVAPQFFLSSMNAMMSGSGMGGMMGQGSAGASSAELAASLNAAFRQAVTQGLLVSAALATVCALILSYFVSHQITQPIQRMLAATRRIGGGHYSERVTTLPANTGDDLGRLAASFNDMAAALEQTERRRLELVGDVAHELRTPLATLTGYLEGLLDGVVESTPETWARLHTESLRLSRLVDDLQELSRAEARQISLRMAAIQPGSIISAARERVEAPYAEKGLELHMPAPADLATFPAVMADPDRAAQALTNLLTNALRYTPAPGRVDVTVTRQGAALTFRVSDTGIGIAAEDLPHLFERFYRVDKSRSRALGGSGIGLTITRALVSAMGGSLRAESAGLGKGSAFTFTLPLAA
ncbi:MAG TPA: ATP-binding protein [Ktedonobacterales bacterium]